MKKYLFTISIMLFVFTLSGCGHEHTYIEATCITPKTCTECGEIEGNALGHTADSGKCDRCGLYLGAVYSDDDMFAIANSIDRLLSSQWKSAGIISECNPSLEDDSIIIIAIFSTIDSTEYTTNELIKLLEEYNIDSSFGALPDSISETYELQNVVLSIGDKNGKSLYLFHNSEKIFQIGDESYDLPIKLITPKEK